MSNKKYVFTGIVDAAGGIVSEGKNRAGIRVLRYVRNHDINWANVGPIEQGYVVTLLITFFEEPYIGDGDHEGDYELLGSILEAIVTDIRPPVPKRVVHKHRKKNWGSRGTSF